MPPAKVPYCGGARRILSDRICVPCGKVFRPKTESQANCSFACARIMTGSKTRGRPSVRKKPRSRCLVCGKLCRRVEKRYCSQACYDSTKSGRKHSEDTVARMRAAQTKRFDGVRQPGKRAERKRIRMSPEWAGWRRAVFERDDYTCRYCGHKGGKLHPHHIRKFADHPELRFDVNNGLTLCVECHKTTDNYGNRKAKKG